MAILAGDSGKVEFGTTVIGNVTSWSVEVSADTADTTTIGNDGWKSSMAVLKSWTASCEVIIDFAATTFYDSSAADIPIGTQVAAEFFSDDSALTASYLGNAYVTGYNVSAAPGDTVKASVTLEGNGALTISA